jgi:hypothetical protein
MGKSGKALEDGSFTRLIRNAGTGSRMCEVTIPCDLYGPLGWEAGQEVAVTREGNRVIIERR